jgi:hypothetical protein
MAKTARAALIATNPEKRLNKVKEINQITKHLLAENPGLCRKKSKQHNLLEGRQ